MQKNFSPKEIEIAKTNSQKFAEVFRFFAPQIYRYVASRMQIKEEVEEVCGQIWEQVVKSFDKFKPEHSGSFPAWLFRIARNKIADFFRKGKIKTISLEDVVEISEESESQISILEKKEKLVAIIKKMQKLPKKQREVIELKYFTDLKNKEIAQVLKISERTVASNLLRGLKKLKNLLEKQ